MTNRHECVRRSSVSAMFRALGFGLATALLATTASLTWAADPPIVLRDGASSPLLLERPFSTILIGDPGVVDVLVRDDRSVILQALKPGATNVIFLDAASIAIVNIGILVCHVGAGTVAYPDRSGCGQAGQDPA
jgi:Flp pilus assembly secretin CpaC